MRVTCYDLLSVFEVRDVSQIKKKIVHTKRLIHCPAMSTIKTISDELTEHAQRLQNTYHIKKPIIDIRERKSE